jgi:thymidylate synthase (FAD)
MDIKLVSKTVGVGDYAELNNEQIIAAIARHGTIKEDNGKLVKYLIDHKHWSPLMFVNFTFKIETRRSISAQIFRHTSLKAQEWSLRYSEPLGFETIDIRREHPTNRQSSTDSFNPTVKVFLGNDIVTTSAKQAIDEVLYMIQNCYEALLEAGVAKECARDILPLCTKTVIHISGNLRDLLSFLNVRCDKHSQLEIRNIATAIGEILEQELPDVFSKIDWRNGMFL